ncbi:hypothetical protein [Acetobacterium wieringae]|uniref:glycosyl-4,4'-diaponeurosporenoate acyltransferase CrtO family protein n=1 Tax=Acetobacterium wieringae TaxID=52694 RepID=UPI0031594AB1
MQLIFLSQSQAILLCFIVWLVLMVAAALLCTRLPERFFDYSAWFYRAHPWENDGEIYQKLFWVRRWKKYLPDGGSLFKGGFQKKKLVSFDKDHLDRYLLESCRAEMIHWLAMLPFWVFGFFTPPIVIFYMLLFALAVNLPCVIAQRYNRPRIVRIVRRNQCVQTK